MSKKDNSFIGKTMRYKDKDQTLDDMKKTYGEVGVEATKWRNRRPICPYGCGEEGNLLEIIMQGDKAVGIYTHSGSVKPFTAELQMAPKPTGRKIVIGSDGEPRLTTIEGEGE